MHTLAWFILGDGLTILGAVILGFFGGKLAHDCPPPPPPVSAAPAWSTTPPPPLPCRDPIEQTALLRLTPFLDPDATREFARVR